MTQAIKRRDAIRHLSGLAAAAIIPEVHASTHTKSKIKIGACDWSINGHSKIEALDTAKKIGLDGVQISLGTVANDMHLRRPEIQQLYKKASAETGVAIGGLAIGELNSIPYKSDPRTEKWVSDSIDVAKAMGCRVILLAFFSEGDLKNDPVGKKEVIRRFKKVASKAENEGIVLGIESWLSAREHMEIIDAVGSPNIKVYYDVANSTQMGYDIFEEIPFLNKQICEVHMKENGQLLGKGVVNFEKVKKALDDISYQGWVQIEGAVPKGGDMLTSYIANNQYLRQLYKS